VPDHPGTPEQQIARLSALVTRLADALDVLADCAGEEDEGDLNRRVSLITRGSPDTCFVNLTHRNLHAARALVSEARRMTNKEGT